MTASKSTPLFLRRIGPSAIVFLVVCWSSTVFHSEAAVHMANGVKIGEVTQNSAIVWVRLTAAPEMNKDGLPFQRPELLPGEGGNLVRPEIASPADGYCRQVPEGRDLNEMETSVPGAAGEVRLTYWPSGARTSGVRTPWFSVDANSDFARQFRLTGLKPGTEHVYRVEGRTLPGSAATVRVEDSFRTAADRAEPSRVVFTVVTGQMWNTRDDDDGQLIYDAMGGLEPSFFVHTGDIVYFDKINPWVTHLDLARLKWNRMYAQPRLRAFHNRVPSYFIKDDHDSWQNDCWPGMAENRMGVFTWEQGRVLFLEQVPMGDKTYRTVRWGKDLQVWLVEGRDFRSPNDMPDGPEKTIWGAEQMAWFEKTVAESDASFRVLISPTPIVGPDHLWKEGKVDNHVASGRTHEGRRVRAFLASQENMYVVCGDRHWQYVSKHPETGLMEYSCGPTTDKHATKLNNDDHTGLTYLREKGGFLSVTVERSDGIPQIAFRHHDVQGAVQNEEVYQP